MFKLQLSPLPRVRPLNRSGKISLIVALASRKSKHVAILLSRQQERPTLSLKGARFLCCCTQRAAKTERARAKEDKEIEARPALFSFASFKSFSISPSLSIRYIHSSSLCAQLALGYSSSRLWDSAHTHTHTGHTNGFING